ncbi:uncharacterized protein LOC135345356 [Halichondria panicea]|uniref:uncharacterized protein LOC135345356 n=1 Tax=Halichondria panicea TaxID=6063 RepID=UPI00312B7FE2
MLLRMRVLVLCMSCLCLWLGKLSVLVSADYVVQVKMLSYSNPFNTRSDVQCCDPANNGGGCTEGERCDTYFIYCLMPRFSTAVGCPSNEPGFTAVSTTNTTDGADIDFSQPTILGLPNPFNLTGISTTWEGAQLYIQVVDLDSSNPFRAELIVRIRFDLSFSVGLTTTLSELSNTRPSITVNATVLCAPFYSGSSCEILDQCQSNPVTCSERERV